MQSDLALYSREPKLQELYDGKFIPLIKQQYVMVERYLLARLGWMEYDLTQAQAAGTFFTRNIGEQHVRIRRNDWPYSIPKEFE